MKPTETAPGAFVVSLDFELAWGVADRLQEDPGYRTRLEGARIAIPRILTMFREYDVRATWAVVGALFAASRDELERFRPVERPEYDDESLSIAERRAGRDVAEDPLHFAPDLVDAVRRTPGQEIASHTFSHYYCRERGQGVDTFRADLKAARAIAERRGIRLRSIVFPRNQHNPAYDPVLVESGITAYRGNPGSYAWRFDDSRDSRSATRRLVRWLDDYVDLTGPGTTPWSEVLQPSGLSDVRASRFLRPWRPGREVLESAWFARMRRSILHAAERGEIFHLWWHPHNFGIHLDENLARLRRVLDLVDRCRGSHGLVSLSMAEVDDRAREMKSSDLEALAKGTSTTVGS